MTKPQPPVLYKKVGRVAHVVLNRPHVLNAMDMQTHEELAQIWNDFERDDALWIGVLSGAGGRAFSVGQDLKELVKRTNAGAESSSFGSRGGAGYPRLTERFQLTKPLIAKINGYALGGGFELALACDVIVASESSCFGLPEAKLGLIAGAGGLFRLTRQIPFKAAMGYLMTGRNIDSSRAYQLGLVNEVVPVEELDACVDRWVGDILKCAPLAVRAIKQVCLASAQMPLEDAFTATYETEERRRRSQDCQEGPLAFIEKRTPNWCAR